MLINRVPTGKDAFLQTVYDERREPVENVLVTPVASEDVANDFAQYGKRTVYELSIPKKDDHRWEDAVVEFWGQRFQTVGNVRRWMEEMVPLDWNGKIRVVRYE